MSSCNRNGKKDWNENIQTFENVMNEENIINHSPKIVSNNSNKITKNIDGYFTVEEKILKKDTVEETNEIYDYYFKIENDGAYQIDENFKLEIITDENVYLDNRYNDILLFRYNVDWIYMIYDYSTKNFVDIPLNYIRTVKFILGDKIEVVGHNYGTNDEMILFNNFSHENIEMTIDFENEQTQDTQIYMNIIDAFQSNEFSKNKNDDIYIVKMFEKMVLFDLKEIKPRMGKPRIEIVYDERHNVYFISAWSLNGRE
jgi:hypothetical protein